MLIFFLIDDNIFPPVSLPRCSCGWSWWSQISTWAPFSSLKTSSVSSKWPPPRLLDRSATPSAPLWEEQTPAWRGIWSDFDFQMLEGRICLPFLKEEAGGWKEWNLFMKDCLLRYNREKPEVFLFLFNILSLEIFEKGNKREHFLPIYFYIFWIFWIFGG